jgi:hypothetical protein
MLEKSLCFKIYELYGKALEQLKNRLKANQQKGDDIRMREMQLMRGTKSYGRHTRNGLKALILRQEMA